MHERQTGTRKKINNVHYMRKTAKWCTTQQTKKKNKTSLDNILFCSRGTFDRMGVGELQCTYHSIIDQVQPRNK